MKRINLVTIIYVVLVCCFSYIYGADSRSNPVRVTYCDGSTLEIYPYSFVTTTAGAAFNCYDVSVTPIPDGLRYGFEDKDDADYNDIVIDLWISGSNTANPVAHIKYVSKEAAYLHWLHAVYNGLDTLVFKAEDASPGAIFDIPLPVRECPDFEIAVVPALQTIISGETTTFTARLNPKNGFETPVNLSLAGLPVGVSGNFTINPINPAVNGESVLNITSSTTTPPGSYNLVVSAAGAGIEHSATVILNVACPDFSLAIHAEPERGGVPLNVHFQALISPSGVFPAADYTYTWDFGDGSTSDLQNPDHTFLTPGRFSVSLTVAEPCGKSKDASATIIVKGFEGMIGKSFSVNEAAPGEEVLIHIRAENSTSYDFNTIIIRDPLSPLLEYIDDNAAVTSQRDGRNIRWIFPVLKKGGVISFDIKAKVSAKAPQGVITNTAYLTHNSLGQGKWLASNTASLTVNVVDVSIVKQVDRITARPGDMLVYRLTLKNNSAAALPDIRLEDEISPYLEFISAVANTSLEFNRQGKTLSWQGALAPGVLVNLTFSARVNREIPAGTKIQNNALLKAAGLKDPLTSNTVLTTIESQPVSITKIRFSQRPDVPQSEVGRIIHFAITLTNLSTGNLIAPQVEEFLPQGFQYVAGTSLLRNLPFKEPRGNRRLLWLLPLVKSGETLELRFQAVIGADAARGRNIIRAELRAVDNSGQDIYAEAQAFINISAAGFIFYSGVEGTVYLDRDDDNFYSPVDTPLPGIEIRLSTGEKSLSDILGTFSFESLFPGEYAVGVNTATLPEKYRLASPYPRVVVLNDGLTDTVDFAVKFKGDDEIKNARLQGRVFFDKNQNQVFNDGEPICETFKARLDQQLITNGSNGTFVFTQLEPGSHKIEILYDEGSRSVTKEITINKGENFIDIPLKFSGIKIVIKGEGQ